MVNSFLQRVGFPASGFRSGFQVESPALVFPFANRCLHRSTSTKFFRWLLPWGRWQEGPGFWNPRIFRCGGSGLGEVSFAKRVGCWCTKLHRRGEDRYGAPLKDGFFLPRDRLPVRGRPRSLLLCRFGIAPVSRRCSGASPGGVREASRSIFFGAPALAWMPSSTENWPLRLET